MTETQVQPALRIACVGECMLELSAISTAEGKAQLGVAGDTLNTAIYMARSLPPEIGRISYVTVLGQGDLSDQIAESIAAEGIDTSHILRHPVRHPGIYAIAVDDSGERSFTYWRESSAAREMFSPGSHALSLLDGFDVIYLSGITLAILPPSIRAALIEHLAALRGTGRHIVFDSNYRARLWDSTESAREAIAAMWRAATIALPSLDDEMALFGDAGASACLDRIAAGGAAEIALKRGARGPLLMAEGRQIAQTYPPAQLVKDTTAAGDAFNAGYLAARFSGTPPADAAAAGHRLASRVIGHPGAILPREPV